MEWRRLLLFIAILSTFSLEAEAKEASILVFGMGQTSCGTWTVYRSTRNSEGSMVAQAWLAGYVTAFNEFNPENGSRDTNIDGLAGWVDNYCKAFPLESVFHAAETLVFKLSRPDK